MPLASLLALWEPMFRQKCRKTFSKTTIAGCVFLTVVFGATTVPGQATHTAPVLELPVRMRQKVEAGKTPAGSKIQAKLVVATLVQGVVIPEDAVLSGEVIESAAKSATDPSRLSIRMDSAEWKNGAVPVALPFTSKIYLTAWYYPAAAPAVQDFPGALPDASHSNSQRRGGSAPYPDPNTPDSPPYSRGNTSGTSNPLPTAPSATISPHRVPMKNMELTRHGDGAVTLTSTRSNIKLDKSTTYVFAAGDLGAVPDSRTP